MGQESDSGRPPWLNDTVERWILSALDCLEENEQGELVQRNENIQRFEILTEEIFDELGLDSDTLLVSQRGLQRRVQDIYSEVWGEEDPILSFIGKWRDLQKELAAEPVQSFEIAFPLNIRSTADSPEELEVLGQGLERIPRGEWRERYVGEAEGNRVFDDLVENSPNPIYSASWTYWRVTVEAREGAYAMDRAEEVIDATLGALQFADYYWKKIGLKAGSSIGPRRWSKLRDPFVYLLFDEAGYRGLYHSTDALERRPTRLTRHKDFLDWILEKLEDLDRTSNLDQSIVGSLRAYHSGLTDHLYDEAFLSMWQALETSTLSKHDDRSADVVRRGRSFIEFKHDADLVQRRLERLARKRNDLVHEATGGSVSKSEYNLVKTLVDSKIETLLDLREDYDRSEIRLMFDEGVKETGLLRQEKRKLERRAGLLGDLIDWRTDETDESD